ncbi:MAG: DNA topoisomerase [Bacteroidales bacterium]
MKLCIAEKPSVGREIAKVLGAVTPKNGYMEGNGYWVSWTFGHLCSLQEPNDYTPEWKTWRLEYLPMIPPSFRLKLINNEGTRRQFGVLADLMARCEEVINCGDAGQEGEVIQRWVMQKAACRVPVKRLWISSLTEEAIKEGFGKLYSASDFDNLYAAGSARAIGDWLLGMNATRAYTLKYGVAGQVLSIGRVQTPTLALLVERQKTIENFKPQKFWELRTEYKNGIFLSTKGRFASEEAAKKIEAAVGGQVLKITKVEKKKAKEHPPKLFDLTLLQVECNKAFGYSADNTLQIIQSLYEKKLTTYPRVDTNFLPNDMYKKAPGILAGLTPYATYTQELLQKLPLRKSPKVFNDKKITDHHAIIPTGEFAPASSLALDEKKVLDLIVRRFIAVFYPDCEYAKTTVMAQVEVKESSDILQEEGVEKYLDRLSPIGLYEFKANGKQIVLPAWRVLFPSASASPCSSSAVSTSAPKIQKEEDVLKEEEEEYILPEYHVGEQGAHNPKIYQKQTQAPKYMNEGDLLKAMETSGKQVENEELRDLMKENGIGRPSTRAAIIETLLKRNYIYKDKKRILPTAMGIKLIETIPNELLKSAELTGQWERKLRMISDGKYSVKEFMEELKEMVTEVILQVKQAQRTVISEDTSK